MATAPIIDLATLLAPLPGDDPAGRDVEHDYSPTSLYVAIKDARHRAREIEKTTANRPGSAADAGPTADKEWRSVVALAQRLLGEQSKNFDVALWLAEGLLRQNGFSGLRDGIAVAAGLLQAFPDGLFPRPDEEGPGTTVATFPGIAAGLIQPLRLAPLSDCLEPGPVAYWQYLIAIDQGRGTRQATDLSREDFEQSVRRSTSGFLIDLRDDLQAAQDAFGALQDAMDRRVGRNAPSCGAVRRELQAIRDVIVNLVGETASALAPKPDDLPPDEAAAPPPTASPPAASDAIGNRDDAFRQLLRIAEYFRKTEPHSPVAMAIEEAVRRGRLSLTDLVAELIPNDEARRMFYLTAGIKPQ